MRTKILTVWTAMVVLGLGLNSGAAAEQGNFVLHVGAKIEALGNNSYKVKYKIETHTGLFSGMSLQDAYRNVASMSDYDQPSDFRIQTVHSGGAKKDYYVRYADWEKRSWAFHDGDKEVPPEGIKRGKILGRCLETGPSFNSINLFVKDQQVASLKNPGRPPQIKAFSASYKTLPEGGKRVPYVSFQWDAYSGNGKWWITLERKVNNSWKLVNKGLNPNFPGTGEFKHRLFEDNQDKLRVRLCITDGFNRARREYIVDAGRDYKITPVDSSSSEENQAASQDNEAAEERPEAAPQHKTKKQMHGKIEIWQ